MDRQVVVPKPVIYDSMPTDQLKLRLAELLDGYVKRTVRGISRNGKSN